MQFFSIHQINSSKHNYFTFTKKINQNTITLYHPKKIIMKIQSYCTMEIFALNSDVLRTLSNI